MKCSRCTKPISILNSSKLTVTGIVCVDCFDELMTPTQTELRCNVCGKTIKPGDSYAKTEKKGILCCVCFSSLSFISFLSSRLLLVLGLLCILFSLTLEVFSIIFSFKAFIYSASFIIIGVTLIGLSKLVEAAELYILKNR